MLLLSFSSSINNVLLVFENAISFFFLFGNKRGLSSCSSGSEGK